MVKVCKYCNIEKPIESFDICRTVRGKVYRRLKCGSCKRVEKNARRAKIRQWLDEYKQGLVCERCGKCEVLCANCHQIEHYREMESKGV